MTDTVSLQPGAKTPTSASLFGMFCLVIAVLAATLFFWAGIDELLEAWQLPEYSHGPLIPILSGLLFLRQLKTFPVNDGPVHDRFPGVIILVVAVLLGAGGRLIGIDDIVAYALILWVGAMLLISFGWATGKHFWPPVVHLVFMLPLPGALYYAVSTYLQGVSSELGVYFVQMLGIPVYLEGNIIDLGVYKLHVAEACSGLRYLFPILSFSYIFAVLYQGPILHKALLLISAAPITVFMNSVRIAIAGWIVNNYGMEHVEGFSHFFQGWVIFISCVLILFVFAWLLVKLRRDRIGLIQALDLETEGLGTQAKRIGLVRPSVALIFAAVLVGGLAAGWQALPKREAAVVERDPLVLFPPKVGDWAATAHGALDPAIENALNADDYLSATLAQAGMAQNVELFIAWYRDQSTGGVHSPEVCLPGAGWEIAKLEQIEVAANGRPDAPFSLNRAIIQKGVSRMLVYYWYEQQGERTASMYAAKMHLMMGKLRDGRDDSAIVRLITPIGEDESAQDAEARLQDSMQALLDKLPRFVPGA